MGTKMKATEYTAKEEKVISAVIKAGKLTIREIAAQCFPGVRPRLKADSWTRNSLRRPVADRVLKKVDRGTYSKGPKGTALPKAPGKVKAKKTKTAAPAPQVQEETQQKAA